MDKTEALQKIISETENIVFFGGAGVSTESGIPDFRSVDGLYHQQWDYPPETILSHRFFMRKPEEFYRFYKAKMLCDTAVPNAAHKKLAEMEQKGKLKAIVTQNIDNLHQMAGSKHVLELHGSVYRNYCMKCGAFYDFAEAEVMIIGGTSLSVYPAASLIDYFQGRYLVVINRDETPRDRVADLVINAPIGEIFEQIHL